MSKPLSYNELNGKFVIMTAFSYQAMWQALNMLEDKLQDNEFPDILDYSKDELCGCIHEKLSVASAGVSEIPSSRDVICDVMKNNTSKVFLAGVIK